MASPSPKRKVEVRFCCCCAAVLLLQTLVPCCPPRHVSPYCHPAARAQSSFSLREAAFWDVQKEHPPPRDRAPVVQGPLGSGWIAVLGMDGRLLLARSGRVYV